MGDANSRELVSPMELVRDTFSLNITFPTEKPKLQKIGHFISITRNLILFLIFHLALSWFGSGVFSVNRKQRVAEFYCISQKSLVMGLPLAGLLIGSAPQFIINIVCPLLLYHFLQLAVGACFLSRLKEWSSRTCYQNLLFCG